MATMSELLAFQLSSLIYSLNLVYCPINLQLYTNNHKLTFQIINKGQKGRATSSKTYVRLSPFTKLDNAVLQHGQYI